MVHRWRLTEIDPVVSDVGVGDGMIDSSSDGTNHVSGSNKRKHITYERKAQLIQVRKSDPQFKGFILERPSRHTQT